MLSDSELMELVPYLAGLVIDCVNQKLADVVTVPGLVVGNDALTDSGLTLVNLADLQALSAAPAAPPAGFIRIYARADGLHVLKPDGTDILLS